MIYGPRPVLSILHPGALGDGLLALNAVCLLKRRFPDHEVAWYGHKELGDLLLACGDVQYSSSFDSLPSLGRECHDDRTWNKGSYGLSRSKRAVGWMSDRDGAWRSYLQLAGNEAIILRSPHDATLQASHMADRYVETVQPWLIESDSNRQNHVQNKENFVNEYLFSVGEAAHDVSNGPEGPTVVVHPGSGSFHKCAPPDVLATLIKSLLVESRRKIFLVGGPADTDAIQKLQVALWPIQLPVMQDMKLRDVIRFLRQADLFNGHDSGLSHLAARMGIRSLLLFGPTDPSKWAPRGDHVTVIRNVCYCRGEQEIRQCQERFCLSFSLDDVITKAEELLSAKRVSMSTFSF